jgi:serine acetyltransferase
MSDALDDWKDRWKLEIEGHDELLRLHQRLREEMRTRWKRSLPFGDELFDRWERAAFLGFARDASIYDSSVVLGDVAVGEGTWIGPFTILDGRGGLSIGKYCSISAGVQIYSHDTVKWALTGGKAAEERSATRIGDCSYIGPLSIIARGVEIGDHSVVGANSFVRASVPPFSIAVGTPARVIGRVDLVGKSDVRFVYDEERSK